VCVCKTVACHILYIYCMCCDTVARNVVVTDQIIIGTPGTMYDMGIKYKSFGLQNINVFVLDEADVMIDTQGHADQSIRILK
jgi:ATP-dependent RNA helicase DDX19/DBP5